jgi:uridylate kinase
MECDLLLKATKVDGVYTKDPAEFKEAKRLDKLSYDQVINQNLQVMDTASIALMRENKIPIIVYSIYEENGLYDVLNGQGKFTYIANHSNNRVSSYV